MNFCDKCGKQIPMTTNACQHCGNNMSVVSNAMGSNSNLMNGPSNNMNNSNKSLKTSVLAVIGFVISLISFLLLLFLLIFAFMDIVNEISLLIVMILVGLNFNFIIITGVGVFLSIIGLIRIASSKAKGLGVAIAGVILGLIAIIGAIIILDGIDEPVDDIINEAGKSAAESTAQLIIGSVESYCALSDLKITLNDVETDDLIINDWCSNGTDISHSFDANKSGKIDNDEKISNIIDEITVNIEADVDIIEIRDGVIKEGTIKIDGYNFEVIDGNIVE